jgi:uncharacterized OsmC-like protein
MSTPDEPLHVTLRHQGGYRFEIDFGEGLASLVGDEPPPLGEGHGPTPSHLLAAAVGNCLASSLTFAFAKFKQDPGGMEVVATCHTGRNAAQRLRIERVDVRIRLGSSAATAQHLDRILGQFEDFCTVTQSLRQGTPVQVEILGDNGQPLRAAHDVQG